MFTILKLRSKEKREKSIKRKACVTFIVQIFSRKFRFAEVSSFHRPFYTKHVNLSLLLLPTPLILYDYYPILFDLNIFLLMNPES